MARPLRPRKKVDYKDPGELTLAEIRGWSGASCWKALGESLSSKRRRPTAHPSTPASGLSTASTLRARSQAAEATVIPVTPHATEAQQKFIPKLQDLVGAARATTTTGGGGGSSGDGGRAEAGAGSEAKYWKSMFEELSALRYTLPEEQLALFKERAAERDRTSAKYIEQLRHIFSSARGRGHGETCSRGTCFLRAQEREHEGPGPFDWSNVSKEAYMSMVDRLIPPADKDMDALDDEKITAAKEIRNLKDIFLEKRGGVHGCKVLALLRENKLATFEKDMTAFTNELEASILPVPKILQLYKSSGLLDEGVDEMDSNGRDIDIRDSPRKRVASCPVNGPLKNRSSKRKRGDAPGSSSALALSKANESLQREMRGHPGTVAEALAIGESLLESHSPGRKRTAIGADAGGAAGDRSTERNKKPKSLTIRGSPGEQPPNGAVLRSPVRVASKTKGPRGRVRVPWTEEEVIHLNAAVKALGTGKWALALAHFKFQECRTSVDLKDKWRNLTKDKARLLIPVKFSLP